MSQLIQFLGTWFGAFCLGLWIPGAIFYGDKYKVINFHKPWLDVIRDIIATVLWPVPFIVDMIKRMNSAANAKKAAEVSGLILLPTLAMANDKFTILGKGAWLIPAILFGVLCYTIPYGYKVWKAGTFRYNDRPGETGKRMKIHVSDRTPLLENIPWLVSIGLIIGLIIFFWVQLNSR